MAKSKFPDSKHESKIISTFYKFGLITTILFYNNIYQKVRFYWKTNHKFMKDVFF